MHPVLKNYGPSLNYQIFPQEEINATSDVIHLVDELRSYCKDFLAALILFENFQVLKSEDNAVSDALRRLPFLAARDGAMTIYHFGKVLHIIRSSFRATPTLLELVDTDLLKQVEKDFDRYFPLYFKMRQAVAHAGENLAPSMDHGIKGPVDIPGFVKSDAGTTVIRSAINGREFIYTFEGEAVSYSISGDSLNQLCVTTEKVYTAFAKAYRPEN
ncbi:hypothetical protein X566_04625 [Afipia sp. P52-10]|uniref:hypothetical protein n=1 Tax=Afipia sp. P52-10 TaxID=1429916 RepID=UPI0003DF3D8C|nr:hypothetical protein [Afipia sp. P52-10]ETR78973.1 hypothetical protein X566_04625 [Afipia sp. P52-10]